MKARATSYAIAATVLLVASNAAFGFELIKGKADVSGYLRGTALMNEYGAEGKDLSLGSDFELTLFDDSYVEVGLVYNLDEKARIHYQVALDNYNLFHLTGDPNNVNFVVRDFFAEVYDVGSPGATAWAGSRKYRRLDEHNIFGGGYQFGDAKKARFGLAHGIRRDFAYWGAQDGVTDTATGDKKFASTPNSYRHMTILDAEKLLTQNSNVILLLEHQFLSATRGSFTLTGTTYKYDLPAVQGLLGGFEVNRWGAGWNLSFSAIASKGDVAGSALSKFNSKGSPAEIMDTTGTQPLTINYYKKHSKRVAATSSGAYFGTKYSGSYIVGYSRDFLETISDKSMLLLQARPFYHFQEKVHVGIDLSRTVSIVGYDRPSYYVVAPTARVSLGMDNYGRPLLQVFYGRIFYDRPYALYDGELTRHATTVGLQFEAWF